MAWSTVFWTLAVLFAYSIGKGVGIAKGREQATLRGDLHVIIKVNGDDVGGFAVTGGAAYPLPIVDHEHPKGDG